MKKIIGTTQYVDCTAIAVSAGEGSMESLRQCCILARDLDAAPGDADSIYFGVSVSDIEEQGNVDFLEDYSQDYRDLDTVLIDGEPLKHFVTGEL